MVNAFAVNSDEKSLCTDSGLCKEAARDIILKLKIEEWTADMKIIERTSTCLVNVLPKVIQSNPIQSDTHSPLHYRQQ